ncbi:MAG: HU family DNA-binding protein [Planctomycetota bacterium]|jgi:integration host factor subunit beta
MATIRKQDLIGQIAESTKTKPSTVKAVVQGFLDEIVSELSKGNRLEFRDFGIFEVREQAARTAHNPQTLELVDVPAKRRVRFKMGRLMGEKLNGRAEKR